MTLQDSTNQSMALVHNGRLPGTLPAGEKACPVESAQAAVAVMSDAQPASARVYDGDKELWEACQIIERCRRERFEVYGTLKQRDDEVNQMFRRSQAYGPLVEKYEALKEKYGHACSDLSHALGDQGRLKVYVEETKSLAVSLDIELKQVKAELTALETRRVQELNARDATIDGLNEDIRITNSKRDQIQAKLDAVDDCSQAKAEATQDFEEQEAFITSLSEEVSRLTTEITSQRTVSQERQAQVAALTSKLEEANQSINALKQAQHGIGIDFAPSPEQVQHGDFLESQKADSYQSLQDENMSLNIQLTMIKDTLRVRYPDLNDNLENLPCLLNEGGQGGKRKKRKSAK